MLVANVEHNHLCTVIAPYPARHRPGRRGARQILEQAQIGRHRDTPIGDLATVHASRLPQQHLAKEVGADLPLNHHQSRINRPGRREAEGNAGL